jgi:chromosome segregation ATPase
MASPDPILTALKQVEENVTERLTARIDALRDEMSGRFDAIEKRLDRLETEYHMIVAALNRIEERLDADDTDRARLKSEVGQLRSRVGVLEMRIQELEARLGDE